MGYYVNIVESNVIIKKENKPDIFKVWCELNAPENDHLKSGGFWSSGKKVSSWFSWMDANYDKTCQNMEDILDMLRFDYEKNSAGDIYSLTYDSKTGSELLFFERAAPYISNGEILWNGEDGSNFYWIFDESKLYEFDKEGLDAFYIIKDKQKIEQSIDSAGEGNILKI